MKFNYDTAWRDIQRLAADNRNLLSILAGVFVFLPYAALLIMLPLIATIPQVPEGANFEVAMKAFSAFYKETMWAFLLVAAFTTLGQLAMLALLGRKPGPTVGEAIGFAGRGILTAWLALLLQTFAINLASLAIVGIATLTALPAVVFLATAAAFAVSLWIASRLSLLLPIIGVDGQINPLKALQSSWQLTAGQGGRLLGFYVLLGVASFVTMIVFVLVTGLLLSLFGPSVAEIGGTILAAFVVSAAMVLFTLVLAAVHRQFRRIERKPEGF